MSDTAIQWTDRVWNPVVGCTKVSQGCKHCYAKTLHDMRHKAFLAGKLQNVRQYAHPFETVQLMPERMRDPLGWRTPSRVFVNSVSDLFHEDVPDEYISDVFITMAEAERHQFQILTKRPARMLAWFTEYLPDACSGERPAPVWPLPNVWLGVSVENRAAADERIPLLLKTPAAIRFLSCEPLLEHVDLRAVANPNDRTLHCLSGGFDFDHKVPAINWVIVGGESGDGARSMELQWARSLVWQCQTVGVPVFVKQLGRSPVERTKGAVTWPEVELRDKHGGDIAEWPIDLRVREFPRR